MWKTSARTLWRQGPRHFGRARLGLHAHIAGERNSSYLSLAHRRTRIRPRAPWTCQDRTYGEKAKAPLTGKSAREALRAHALRVEEISNSILALDSLPQLWEYEDLIHNDESKISDPARQQVYRDVMELLDNLQADVDSRLIEPQGRHRVHVSILVDAVLRCLAVSDPPGDGGSVYSQCDRIMKRMTEWSIDLQHSHCKSIMLVAGREGLWKEASRLFAKRIDPRASGLTPVNIDVSDPIGLYCIARHAQEQGLDPVEIVLNGVLNMSIVCPSEQGRYVLAAGSALGQAGEAESLMQYLLTNSSAKKFGQHLVAATAHACLHCSRPDDAIRLFDNLTEGDHQASVEWQWEGGKERLLPICRDLAMRALGVSSQSGTTDECVAHLVDVEQRGLALSFEAFLGFLLSCEKDGEWEKSVDFLFYVVEKDLSKGWLVDGSSLQIPHTDTTEEIASLGRPTRQDLMDALEITMRTCNASGKFGVSLLCAQRFALMPGMEIQLEESSGPSAKLSQIFQSLSALSHSPIDFLATICATLVASNCTRALHDLERLVSETLAPAEDPESFLGTKQSFDQTELWADFLENARILNAIANEPDSLSSNNREIFSHACSRTFAQASAGGDPSAALVFLEWMLPSTPLQKESTLSLMRKIASTYQASDDLTAEIMDALITNGQHIEALEIFGEATAENSDLANWLSSSNRAVRALFQVGRENDARALFEKAVESKCHPDTFVVTAQGFLAKGQHDAVFAIYKRGLKNVCLSEHLSMLALQAVSSSKGSTLISDKMKRTKQIVVAVAKLTGVHGWSEQHYWHLKNVLKFGPLRWLMKWSQVDSVFLDELELALKTLEHRSATGLQPISDLLHSVARAAATADYEAVLSRRPDLKLVPRSQHAWASELQRIATMAEDTSLFDDAEFVSDLAMGFTKAGCREDFLKVVKRSLREGLALRDEVLEEAAKIASEAQTPSHAFKVSE